MYICIYIYNAYIYNMYIIYIYVTYIYIYIYIYILLSAIETIYFFAISYKICSPDMKIQAK